MGGDQRRKTVTSRLPAAGPSAVRIPGFAPRRRRRFALVRSNDRNLNPCGTAVKRRAATTSYDEGDGGPSVPHNELLINDRIFPSPRRRAGSWR